MSREANAQYNLAKPDALAIRIANRARFAMFDRFMREFNPAQGDSILDVGVTSDRVYASSNYLEMLYPHKAMITATGIDDGSFLEQEYPGLKFRFANALDLPFENRSFDYVHSSAVLEHVGSSANQRRMIIECARVARKGICLTTPNRWFPVEFHTQMPFAHWLPKPWFRKILRAIGQADLAREENLNLMSAADLRDAFCGVCGWNFRVATAKLLLMPSNLILFGHCRG